MKSLFFFGLTLVAVTIACGVGESLCNGQCYNPSYSVCLQDCTGNLVLCGAGNQVCNGACYSPSSYHCSSCALAQGPGANTPTPTKASTTSSAPQAFTTTTTKASTSVNRIATTSSTTSSTVAPTTSSTAAPAASAAVVAPTTAAASVQVPSPCYTANYCSSTMCACSGACYKAGQYNCPTDGFTSKLVLCQGNYGSCDGNCYDTTKYSCVSGKLVVGGTPLVTSSTSSTTSSTAAPAATTQAAVIANPTPVAGNGFPAQTADLRIINSCKTTLWFEARHGGAGAPLPGQSVTSQQALPGSYVDYTVPDTGLSGSRFWAKYGCDANGQNCLIGDQMQYWPNPPGGCPAGGCTPPVDSLFEATWGCRPGSDCNAQNPTTWFDTSQVDGWTIPYKLTPVGDTSGCDCNGPNCGFKGVDASTLDLSKCPKGEDLTANGNFSSVITNGQTVSLKSVDLRIINNGQVLGCMSPCKRLNWGTPYGLQQPEDSGATMWMCCPTPTPADCSPSNGCISPTTCRQGPIENTQFVAAVHSMAPGVYSYSYDDGVGLHACPAGVTKYTMEFCPAGSAAYPGTA